MLPTLIKLVFRIKIYVFSFLTFISVSCNSVKWHTFQANNQRTGFVDRPEVRTPEIKWKTYIGIQGYLNNTIINSGDVYVGSSGNTHNQPDSLDGIYSVKKSTGKINWHFKTLTDANGVAFSKNKIYATSDDGYLRCISAGDGKEVWSIQREGELYSQPLVINNSVIIGDATGVILIIDINSGKIIKENKVASSNVRGGLSSDGENIYATFVEGIIACLDKNGNLKWKVKGEFNDQFGEDFYGIYASPTIYDNNLIVPFIRSTYYDTPAVYAYNKTNGELVWRATDNSGDTSGNVRSSVAIANGYIYYGSTYSNTLARLNLADGILVNEYPMGKPTHPHWPSPVIANNMLYLGRHDGSFNAFDIKSNTLIWQLFIGDHNNTKQPKNKHTDWWNPQNGSVYATPSIDVDGTIYVGSGEGWLFAIRNKE